MPRRRRSHRTLCEPLQHNQRTYEHGHHDGEYPQFQHGMPENYLARFRQRSCSPLRAVAPPHSAVISMSAPVADIALPSRITVAAIAIARSVRPDQATLRAMAIAAT